MILSPDFFHHWKTVTLQAEHGPEGVLALIRLWAHCYDRRGETFRATPAILKTITGMNGSTEAFEASLADLRLLERDGENITMRGWKDHNKKLFTSAENGRFGGRPKQAEKERQEKPKKDRNPAKNFKL
jgi:hypothetical protein